MKYIKIMGQVDIKNNKRQLAVLLLLGIILTCLWWWNATLVYDDVILALKESDLYGFSFLVEREGWFSTLLHFLCLDLPNQYRTYGISRAFQFVLWTIGISSAKSYSLIISGTHVGSVLILYFLLLRIGRSANDALFFCVIWMLSPYLWTSCFHHYSYLTLPTQILIVGSFFLLTLNESVRKSYFAAMLGVLCGLTGELHLVAVCLVLGAVATVTRDKSFIRAAVLVVVAMICSIVVHYILWKIFESNPELQPRFALSLSHDWSYWSFRLLAAFRSIYIAFVIPIKEMDNQFVDHFLVVMLVCSLLAFSTLWWLNKGQSNGHSKYQLKNEIQFFFMLLVIGFSYFLIYMAVVILSDSIPYAMPRRYGYIPLTMILIACFGILLSAFPWPRAKAILASLAVGATGATFLVHQFLILPTIRAQDLVISQNIADALVKADGAGVLFFNASSKDLPRKNVYPDSFGPAMQSNEGTEYTQATYGTYWPAEMQATRILKAQFACDIGHILLNGKVEIYCPYGNVKKYTNWSEAIVVANLGYEEKDIFGRNVRIFSNLNSFMPHYFSRKIIKEHELALFSSKVFFELDVTSLFRNKNSGENQSLLQTDNLSIINLSDHSLTHLIKSHKSLMNVGKFEAGDVLGLPSIEVVVDNNKKKDLDILMVFDVSNPSEFKKYLHNTYVSWNNGSWVSLGDDQLSEKNLHGKVGVRLSHLDVVRFSILAPSLNTAELGISWKSLGVANK